MPRWASAVTISRPSGVASHDDGRPDRVEDLVPLHGLADVLDVVEAAELAAGNAGVGVVEPGGDHEAVLGDLALAGDVDGLAASRRSR